MLTLLAAAVIALIDGSSRAGQPLIGRFGDATAILLIVAINSVLGFVQEQRAEAALAALETMQTPNARVRRADAVQVVGATCLVAGDILELEAGDAVPADARLLQTIGLFVEESSLDGRERARREGLAGRGGDRRAARRSGHDDLRWNEHRARQGAGRRRRHRRRGRSSDTCRR